MLPFNRVNVPPFGLVSTRFNEKPVELAILGARTAHAGLFRALEGLPTLSERSAYFQGYVTVAFGLRASGGGGEDSERLIFRRSFLSYLMGWMFDSNSVEGAALKGWVESRFGLVPLFHRVAVASEEEASYRRYRSELARADARAPDLHRQLDLLFEFIQEELRRAGSAEHVTLYRGVRGLEDHRVLGFSGRRWSLWLNNLNSFTRNFERAWEFGDRVIEVAAPRQKIVFDGALLPGSPLQGEEEVLVLGGKYDVRVHTY